MLLFLMPVRQAGAEEKRDYSELELVALALAALKVTRYAKRDLAEGDYATSETLSKEVRSQLSLSDLKLSASFFSPPSEPSWHRRASFFPRR